MGWSRGAFAVGMLMGAWSALGWLSKLVVLFFQPIFPGHSMGIQHSVLSILVSLIVSII